MKYRASLCIWAFVLSLVLCAPQAQAQFEKKPWPKGRVAPSTAYTDLSGKVWDLNQLKDKVVILNFWATWCAPCLEELPSLQTFQDFSNSNELVILTINVKEMPSKINQFVHRNAYTFPVITDRQGDIAKKWGVKLFPTSILISTQGKPTWIIEGPVDWTSQEITAFQKSPSLR
jgi:thiol-disulfide isomerase/thioredoxin